jgi:hypothetical protein
MANSKYFETSLTSKNEIYSAWGGGGLCGGTILFILKNHTLGRCGKLHALPASALGQWHGTH